jgi:hypothetical protein
MFVREEQLLFALSVHQRLELCLIELDRLLLFAVDETGDNDMENVKVSRRIGSGRCGEMLFG